MITASKLYDYLQCPHKVWRDQYGPRNELTEEVNPFVKMLWEKGVQHEKEVVSSYGEVLDLSQGSYDERTEKTLEAIKDKIPIIYQGVIKVDDLFGIPDLLLLKDGIYYPVDIKSGSGLEHVSSNENSIPKPKKHYAVQLAVYVDILNRLKIIDHKTGYIVDSNSIEVVYNLNLPLGRDPNFTYWDLYNTISQEVKSLLNNEEQNLPAISSSCKLCNWYSSCKNWAEESNDLTLLYRSGRRVRDKINSDLGLSQVNELINISIPELMERKRSENEFLKGIGQKTLETLKIRANLFENKVSPVIHNPLEFPKVSYELFFDIEDDPTQEYVYMHGVYERSSHGERFLHFTANDISGEEEKRVWSDFWDYIKSLPTDDFSVYYYSHHEKTTYLKLQKKYPDVISEDEVIAFFKHPNVIDLFKYIDSSTDWPVSSYSLKEIATYLGFSWRDETPSGALSILWFNEYLNNKDENILNRILEYNEDDCIATMVIKDGLVNLLNAKN